MLRDGADVDLRLTDDGLAVVAGHVVELDPVVVEVVEDGEAVLVTITVVGLGTSCSKTFNIVFILKLTNWS